MDNSANEWREEIEEFKTQLEMMGQDSIDISIILSHLRTTLDQHSAQLVAKIENERDRIIQWATTEAENKQFREIRRDALDQAIDIVKDNK